MVYYKYIYIGCYWLPMDFPYPNPLALEFWGHKKTCDHPTQTWNQVALQASPRPEHLGQDKKMIPRWNPQTTAKWVLLHRRT